MISRKSIVGKIYPISKKALNPKTWLGELIQHQKLINKQRFFREFNWYRDFTSEIEQMCTDKGEWYIDILQ